MTVWVIPFAGLIALGLWLLGLGAYGYRDWKRSQGRIVPVTLRVTDIVMRLNAEDEPRHSAVYVVEGGLHSGHIAESPVADFQALHKVGDRIDGWFDPEGGKFSEAGALSSDKDQMHLKFMPIWAMVFGTIPILAAFIWVRPW